MAGTHEHLEHAEHAEHHAHHPFDKRVAVTIAIVAACLAMVAMLGHRKHNEVITLKTEATELEVKASNGFAWYQATKARQQEYMLDATLAVLLANKSAPESHKVLVEELATRVAKLKDLDHAHAESELKSITKEFGKIEEEMRGKLDPWQKLQVGMWRAKVKEYDSDLEVRLKGAKGEQEKAEKVRTKADHVHHQADYLDYAHLAVELGLVLGSIAVLTKRRSFWGGSIILCIAGLALMAYAFMMPHHPHNDGHGSPGQHQEQPAGKH